MLYSIIATIVALIFLAAFVLVFVRAGYLNKVLVKLGLKESTASTNWTAFSWDSCLKKLNYKADIAFFGDSITRGGDFHEYFKDYKIINLGCTGDNLQAILNRVSMVESVAPKKVFLMGGINALTDFNIEKCTEKFDELIVTLKKAVPDAELYIESVLPISKQKETSICRNSSIIEFNKKLKELAEKHKIIYIDLHSLYYLNGEIDPKLTKEGVHLQPEAYSLWKDAIEKYIA